MRKAGSNLDAATEIVQKSQRNAFLNSKGISPNTDHQLSLIFAETMHDNERFLPNDYARSALFTARNAAEPRRTLQNIHLFHLHREVTITYTGIELRAQDDELVWMQILYYAAKRAPLGKPFNFSIKELVSDIGWPKSGQYYERARACISRLKASEIQINNDRAYGRGLAQSLIKHYEFRNDKNGKPTDYTVILDEGLIYVLAGNTFTNHNWEKYRKLSPIARRLVDYAESHKHPFPLSLEAFHHLCDSKCESDTKWAQRVKNASEEIKGVAVKDIVIKDKKIHFVK